VSEDSYITIPVWDKGIWTHQSFKTIEDFRWFLIPLLKEPGKYNFDETSRIFNEQARIWNKTKVYCIAPFNSKDYITYWDDQKERCRFGVIFKSEKDLWYIPRDYYMWLNFLPIYDKEQARYDFPKVRDAQYHMALYEHLAELHYLHVAVLKKRQIASEQPHSEPILTIDGWRTMGDIEIGDLLWNPDGTLTKVLNKTNNGVSEVYQFDFIDGRSTRCGIDHNWLVYDRVLKKEKVINTRELLKFGLFSYTNAPTRSGKKEYKSYRYAIKYTNPISFLGSSKLEINPYLLGCLIGDGSIKGNTVQITSMDIELVNYVKDIVGSDYNVIRNFTKGKASRYGITYKKRFSKECKKYYNGQYGCNPISRSLLEIGLKNKICTDKFIPQVYLESTIQDRLDLLRGLMDTDGYINSTGKDIHYTTVSEQLAKDVAYLTRSLSIKTVIDKKSKAKSSYSDYYRVRLSGHIPFNIFKLTRKANRFKKRKDSFPLCPIINITKLDYLEESSCIVVDNPNQLYITKDFIVTHNSYFHAAKLINQIWFEEGPTMKMGASHKDYINEKGTWKFLNEYRSFLDEHTAWYRPMNPGKVMMWQQQIEITKSNRKSLKGNKGTIQGLTFDKDATNGVGGPVKYFFHEEAGIAPKMDTTYEFLLPSVKSGHITTGMFIAAGSVGDLDQCEPLKKFILYPEVNSIYAVETDLLDDKGTIGTAGLFIPEQWSMPPYIDQYGNSLVEEAVKAIDEERLKWKKELTPDIYQLRISQHPKNIAEAFAFRKASVFPTNLLMAQQRRIQEKEYGYEFLELDYDTKGKVESKSSNRLPINEFPISSKTEDKKGVLVVWERPVPDPDFGMYYASIDPVSEGRTTTSDSLVSIIVYKNPVEVTKITPDGPETSIERDKIVATWCGRYDDIKHTHEKLEKIVEWYNAWTVVENNISLFIQHMISKKKQRYLVPKNQMLFLKDIGSNTNVFQEYGWKNTGTLFKSHLLSYAIEFLKEELDIATKPDGTIVKTTYGVERIPDPMLIVEMLAYEEGLNVDRLVSFCALVAFAKVQQANRGLRKRVIESKENLQKNKDLYKLSKGMFTHMGVHSKKTDPMYKINRSPFKNIK